MEKKIIYILKIVLLLWVIYSCKKEYDYPPLKQAKDGAELSIAQLKSRLVAPLYFYKFGVGDTNLYCTVLSDESSGNFYEEVFVRDDRGAAIQLNLKESGGLRVGDRIRVNLNNLYLVMANNMIYLDSVDVVKSVVKLSTGNEVNPIVVSPGAILQYSATPGHTAALQSQLVELKGVEFKPNNLMPTFADAVGKTSATQTISSCEAGIAMTVRTSGRSNFAGKLLPKGNGSLVGIVTQYNTNMELVIREYNDVNMNGPLCAAPVTTPSPGIFLLKDFNDNNLSSGGWISYSVLNTAINWQIGSSTLTPTPYAKISGYAGGNTASENWLISPPVNLSSAKDPVLSFKSAAKYSGTILEVLASVNYSSGDPNSATWTSLAPGYVLSPSSGDYVWTSSGYVNLSVFKNSTTRIAFKYKSTLSGATNYQLDDIVIKER